jgi:hypothetical protein
MSMRNVVFTFGRFQPPTGGHELLISTVVETAKRIGGDHYVFLSQSHDNSTNPLEWNFKRRVCEAAFKGVNISRDTTIRNPYLALEYLKEHYNKIVMVAGSDQVAEYTKRFSGYANTWGVDFQVINAGNRINESEGVQGISGTKMRQYALDNNAEKFMESLPSGLNSEIRNLVFRNTKLGLK